MSTTVAVHSPGPVFVKAPASTAGCHGVLVVAAATWWPGLSDTPPGDDRGPSDGRGRP